jgi:hypothetical protein
VAEHREHRARAGVRQAYVHRAYGGSTQSFRPGARREPVDDRGRRRLAMVVAVLAGAERARGSRRARSALFDLP